MKQDGVNVRRVDKFKLTRAFLKVRPLPIDDASCLRTSVSWDICATTAVTTSFLAGMAETRANRAVRINDASLTMVTEALGVEKRLGLLFMGRAGLLYKNSSQPLINRFT